MADYQYTVWKTSDDNILLCVVTIKGQATAAQYTNNDSYSMPVVGVTSTFPHNIIVSTHTDSMKHTYVIPAAREVCMCVCVHLSD